MITLGYSTVYLLRVLKENDFYAYNSSTEGAFCSESGSKTFYVTKNTFKWTVSTAKRQLTYPEGGRNDNDTYAESSSGKDDINMEGSGGESSFDMEGIVVRMVSIQSLQGEWK